MAKLWAVLCSSQVMKEKTI